MSDATTAYREAVAGEVRSLMGRHRVSQTRLAAALGMSQSALSRRLNGELPFDLDDVLKMADHFHVPLSAFVPATLNGGTAAYRALAAQAA
jgi:transcriptional regulator with XRE-family HTH domain